MRSSRQTPAFWLMCALVALYAAAVAVLITRQPMALPLFGMLCVGLFAALLTASRAGARLDIALPAAPDRFPLRTFALSAGLCLLVMALYLVGYYPGGYSSDSVIQWFQLSSLDFQDQHPALHTLMLFALSRIVNSPVFLLFVQMLCFALAVGYASATLQRWHVPLALWLSFTLYLCLSPGISNMMAFLWKDCAFSICALVLGVQLVQIHLSQGAWLRHPLHIAALAVTLCLCSILRHNGPALTLPAAVWLFISLPAVRKRAALALLCAVALFAGIKGPLYDAAHVQRNAGGLTETYGVPMVVLSHIYAESPESLDAETVAYLETVAPWQVYHDYDDVGDFNSIKWHLPQSDLSGYTLSQVCGYAWRAALAEPALAIEALSYLWQTPLFPFCHSYWRMSPYVDPVLGMSAAPLSEGVRRVLNALCRYSAEAPVSWLFWNPGFFMLAVMLGCVLCAWRRPLSALTLPAMLIAYNLATCMALSSPTDYRFFLSTPMLAPLCLIALFAHPATFQTADPLTDPERRIRPHSRHGAQRASSRPIR